MFQKDEILGIGCVSLFGETFESKGENNPLLSWRKPLIGGGKHQKQATTHGNWNNFWRCNDLASATVVSLKQLKGFPQAVE